MNSEFGLYQDVLEQDEKFVAPSILVVEDDEFCSILISEFLEELKYKLSFANNGEEAIKLFNSNNFDLVLLDIQLPKIDGVQVAKHIKSLRPDIPLIAVTASVVNYNKLKNCGIDMVVEKPISFDKLLRYIKQYI